MSSSSAKSVRSDIISAISRDDPRLRALGAGVSQHHAPLGHTRLLDDASHQLNGRVSMSGTSLLRNPSQTYFRKEVLPSSSELGPEDSLHTPLQESKTELVSVQDNTSLQNTGPTNGQEEPPASGEDRGSEKNDGSSCENRGSEKNDGGSSEGRDSEKNDAGGREDRGSEKNDASKSDSGSLDTESSVSLQTQPVEPCSPPGSPEERDMAPGAGAPSPTPNLQGVQTLHGTTSNIDVELEIFVDRGKTSPANEPEGTPATPAEESRNKDEVDAPLASSEYEESRVRRRRSLEAPQHALKPNEAQERPSMLRSGPGGRARSSSVGHKVRFTGQCSFGEANNDPDLAQDDSRAARRHGRRSRRKGMHRSG